MKTSITLALAAATLAAAAAADAAALALAFDNVQSTDGSLMLAVYDSADHYRKTPVRVASLPAGTTPAAMRFADLPAGDYAVAAFHDRNGNGKLDTNLVGIPSEPYGFSRNPDAKGASMGPPAWDDARFALPESGAHIVVKLSN